MVTKDMMTLIRLRLMGIGITIRKDSAPDKGSDDGGVIMATNKNNDDGPITHIFYKTSRVQGFFLVFNIFVPFGAQPDKNLKGRGKF